LLYASIGRQSLERSLALVPAEPDRY
jgi:hypothetical protein